VSEPQTPQEHLEWLYEHGTVEDVEMVMEGVLGEPLHEALGPAYSELEGVAVEYTVGIDHPAHNEVLQRLSEQFGADRAALLALGMFTLVKAQTRRAILHPTPDQLEDAQSLDDLPPALLTLIDRKDGVEMVWRDEDVALDEEGT
jgi:hypothetical protein